MIEGRNVAIEYRWAEGQYDRLPALATDLVGRRVVVIVAYTDRAALAAKAATTTIPIVFLIGDDPIKLGLVASLARPGENLTGVSWFGVDLEPKQLSLLHELVPNAAVIALLEDLNAPNAATRASRVQAAARALGLQLIVVNARTSSDIDMALRTLCVSGSVRSSSGRALFLSVGAIKSFRSPRATQFRRCMDFVNMPPTAVDQLRQRRSGCLSPGRRPSGRIFKGDKPADLPVEQATKFELVINLKTAKALGLDVPLSVHQRSDEVIE